MHQMRFVNLILLFPVILFSNWDPFNVDNEDPTLFYHVNVITGHLSLCIEDTVVQGIQPFPIIRTYSSSGSLEKNRSNLDLLMDEINNKFLLEKGWKCLPHLYMTVEVSSKTGHLVAYIAEKNGNLITYDFVRKVGKYKFELKPSLESIPNYNAVAGVPYFRNNSLILDQGKGYVYLTCADKSNRVYKRSKNTHGISSFRLLSEILPNQRKVVYSYGHKKRLEKIEIKNPSETKTYSSINFTHEKTSDSKFFEIQTSDRKKLKYRFLNFDKRDYLSCVEGNGKAEEKLIYESSRKSKGYRLSKMFFANNLQFVASYNKPANMKQERKWADKPYLVEFGIDRVNKLEAVIDKKNTTQTIADFVYKEGVTVVRDSENILTKFYYEDDKLNKIEYYNNQDQLTSVVQFIWKAGFLQTKALLNNKNEPFFAKSFVYDIRGNLIKETLRGNLSGELSVPFVNLDHLISSSESYSRSYKYHPYSHLIKEEREEDGLTYKYQYKDDTDLLTSKMTCYEDVIIIREFFLYDKDNILIEEIVDDGKSWDIGDLEDVTERKIKRYCINSSSGLPDEINEFYYDIKNQSEKLIRRVQLKYNSSLRVAREAVFDSLANYRYTINTSYNAKGKITSQTTPLGLKNQYIYNSLGLLTKIKEVSKPTKNYSYDSMSRPYCCTEIDFKKNRKEIYTTYDLKGRLISKKDHRGRVTNQKFDSFGRCVETQLSEIVDDEGLLYNPIIQFSYDIEGNIISYKTPLNEETATFYNLYKKPCKIVQADGCEIKHIYYKNGDLFKTIYPDRTYVVYQYDALNRMTSKEIFSKQNILLSQEMWNYNSFHLISYINPVGLTTYYEYDCSGKLIYEKSGDREKRYFYDSLGYLERVSEKGVTHVQIHNIEGQIIEQWDEDDYVVKENYMQFFYDEEGCKIESRRNASQGVAVDKFSYDGEGRLSCHINPLNEKTQFVYEDHLYSEDLHQNISTKSTIDALGNITVETFDSLSHLILIEKKSSNESVFFKENFYYDRSGNKVKRITTVYRNNVPVREIMLLWEYDNMGRIIKQIEPEEKITTYTYNNKGLVEIKALPNQIKLVHEYDNLGRLTRLRSTDFTIDYSYFYDKGNSPIHIIDHIDHHDIKKKYNLFGELMEEDIDQKLHYEWKYNNKGQCISFTLPDTSSVSYIYNGHHLTNVQRHKLDGSDYEHVYKSFDENGHVKEEELILNLGTVLSKRDILERNSSQESLYYNQSISYGPSGLVETTDNSIFGCKTFSYDPLNQLTKENEKTYSFDSLGNNTKYEVNDNNEIIETDREFLFYNKNGCPIGKHSLRKPIFYDYDALNRLKQIMYGFEDKVVFHYNESSKPLCKINYHYTNRDWIEEERQYYLYDKEYEIGKSTETCDIKELKILGLGIKGDIGSSLAIEINDEVYVPLNDFSGNVIALLSSLGEIVEKYELNAFGVEKSFSEHINPWRFCSKRVEENLVLFGTRFYDQSLGRWLTPDSAGFVDSSNLYLYVLNSPTNRLDLFGLFSEGLGPSEVTIIDPRIFHPPVIELPLICLKGVVGASHVDLVVSSNYIYKLHFSPEELNSGVVKIIDHFSDIMPKEGMIIGLITYQNGINTSLNDFKEMGESILEKVPNGTMLIGLHNPTEGIFKDVMRTRKEIKATTETENVSVARQFLEAIVDRLDKINPELLWTHIAHSEGGAINYRAIETMNPEKQEQIKKHLIFYGVAPGLSVPRKFAFSARNVYSEKDYITKWWMLEYKNDPNYDIQIIPCISKWHEKSGYFADHAFMGPTYQGDLTQYMDKLESGLGFYDVTSR